MLEIYRATKRSNRGALQVRVNVSMILGLAGVLGSANGKQTTSGRCEEVMQSLGNVNVSSKTVVYSLTASVHKPVI
jgi:hypothetical protein